MSVRPISVVIVDDSLLMRTLLRSALEAEGDIVVKGSAREPYEARDMIKAANPDVVTLDVEMPGMNGLEFLQKIMSLRPMPVVMVSSLTSAGADATLTALQFGAVDFIAKPSDQKRMQTFGAQIRQKVRDASRAKVRPIAAAPARRQAASGGRARGSTKFNLLTIGASTGGVAAVGAVLNNLPVGMPPIVIVQHMPEKYTQRFAERLKQQTGHDVAEAREGELLSPGMVRIAPGSHHMEVAPAGAGYTTRLASSEPVSGHRPSVDVLFRSAAKAAGAKALAVMLTGMGRDGAQGMLQMRQAGAMCLGESQSSCVVYGMPKAAQEIGALHEQHDLDRIPSRMRELVSGESVRVSAVASV